MTPAIIPNRIGVYDAIFVITLAVMDTAETAALIATLYPAIYRVLHSRWHKSEQRPSAEALAVMTHLHMSGPLTVGEAALHFDRAQSAMSELIDRAQTAGWLDRAPDGRDRRRTLVWLTDAGLQILNRSNQVLDAERLTQCLEQLSSLQRTQLVESMQALLRAAEQLNPQPRSKS